VARGLCERHRGRPLSEALGMRIGRVAAAVVIAPIVAALPYAGWLAYHVPQLRGDLTPAQIVLPAFVLAVFALVFVVVVLLPFSLVVRHREDFRAIVTVVGVVAWFVLTCAALFHVGREFDSAVANSVKLLTLGVPAVAVYAVIVGSGPHA
jgi:hypothetical protein